MHQKTLTVYDDEGGVRNFTAADVAELQSECKDLRAELTAKEKALSSAKIALDAKDRAYSAIEQRFSAMVAKAATTDSERECNERLTAEIDALAAELAEANSERSEQSRLLGISAEKELKLMAELAEARRVLAPPAAVPEAVAKVRADEIIQKIIDYGYEKERGASCVYRYEAKQYDLEAASILNELRAILSAETEGRKDE